MSVCLTAFRFLRPPLGSSGCDGALTGQARPDESVLNSTTSLSESVGADTCLVWSLLWARLSLARRAASIWAFSFSTRACGHSHTNQQNTQSVYKSYKKLVSFLFRQHFLSRHVPLKVSRKVLKSSPRFPWAQPWRVWLPVYSSLHPSGSTLPPPLPPHSLNWKMINKPNQF